MRDRNSHIREEIQRADKPARAVVQRTGGHEGPDLAADMVPEPDVDDLLGHPEATPLEQRLHRGDILAKHEVPFALPNHLPG
jgi:hypothetical protein